MTSAVVDKLRGVVGPAHVVEGVALSPYVIDGRTPLAAVFPGSAEETAVCVRAAADAGVPVVPWGGGTAMHVGAPSAAPAIVLGLARLSGLIEHEPGDLTATAGSGMTLDALQAALRVRGQWLSLDAPDGARATLGGIVAANGFGPRRHLYGTMRDLLIGVTVVTAEGAIVRGGGKVVKNVAGYDVPKLFIGSYGTLGVIVDVTVKLRPLPDAERFVAARFERLKDAASAVRALMAGDLVPNAVELLDTAAATAAGLGAGAATLVVGFDGLPEQVAWQERELAVLVKHVGGRDVGEVPATVCPRLARAARDAFDARAAIMTMSVLPSLVAETMEQGAEAARQRGLTSAWCAHAGVGVVTGAVAAPGSAHAAAAVDVLGDWRASATAGGGHASVVEAPLAVKSALPAWDEAGPAGRVMRRIKTQLDPRNILNPGRFVAGI